MAIGHQALNNTEAAGNTALGYLAGNFNTLGTNNTLIGNNADVLSNNLTNATAIGYNAVVAQSNSLVLGVIGTNVGIGNTSPLDLLHVGTGTGATVRIGSAETLQDFGVNLLATNANFIPETDNLRSLGNSTNRWTAVWAADGTINTSDARDKENISNLNYGLKEIMKLRPVSFTWKENPQRGKKLGFIAQEVQPVLGEVVQVGDFKTKAGTTEEDGNDGRAKSDKLGIYYSDIIPVTVKAIQEQQQTIESQNKQIEELKRKNEQLEKDMQLIKSKLGIKN